MRYRPALAVLLSLLVPVAGAFALDFGVDLDAFATLAYDGFGSSAYQGDSATLWLSAPIGSAELRLSAAYYFEGEFPLDPAGDPILRPWRLDAGESWLRGAVPAPFGPSSRLSYELGRVPLADPAGVALSGLSDGARVALELGTWKLSAFAGYTGLLYKGDARVLVTEADREEYADPDVLFAPKRLFGGLELSVVEFLPRHDLALDLFAQSDLRDGDDALDTQYAEAYLDGRPARGLRWKAYCALETGFEPEFFAAMASGLRIRYALPESLDLRLGGSIEWASGPSGPFVAFSPLRRVYPALVAAIPFVDLLFSSFEATVRPLPALTVGPAAVIAFRASGDRPADPNFPAESTGRYLGTELSGAASLAAASDVALELRGGAFLPNVKDGYPAGTPARWSVSLRASLKM